MWRNIHLWVKVEESSEDEAAGELAKRGLGKLGSVENNRSESDLSGPLSLVSNLEYTCTLHCTQIWFLLQVSNFSSMESLNTLDAARRLSDVGPYHYVHPQGHGGAHSPRGFPGETVHVYTEMYAKPVFGTGGYRGRPMGPRPFPPGMSGPRPPWPAGRGSPRPRPPHFSPRQGFLRG